MFTHRPVFTVPFFKIIWQQPSSHIITSAVAQWIECQPYDWSVVSLNPNKNYCCVSLSKKFATVYPHCLVLVGSRKGFERDLH